MRPSAPDAMHHSTAGRPRLLGAIAVCIGLCAGGFATAQNTALPSTTDSRFSQGKDVMPHQIAPAWVDEVRAQREAWEARRDAARQAHETRLRLNNPRGAAHRDAWAEELRQRRQEQQEWIDQERSRFIPPGPAPFTALGTRPAEKTEEPPAPSELPLGEPLFPPPGWNNLWYFRSY